VLTLSKIGKILLGLLVALFVAMLIINPAAFLERGREAVLLCIDVIIPSLFPFLVAAGILVKLGLPRYMSRNLSPLMRPLFNIPGSGALALVMGLISGYPIGAKIARELYDSGDCTKTEAERMLAFCNNSGPLFIIGAIGVGMLSSPAIGYVLYVSHVLAAISVGLIFRFYKRGCDRPALPPKNLVVRKEADSGIIGSAVYSAVGTMAKICAFVILFGGLVGMMPNLGNSIANALGAGIIEISAGISEFTALQNIALPVKLAVISFMLSFSGLSVTTQVSAIISGSGLSMLPCIAGKFLSGIISGVITYVICVLVPLDIQLNAQAFAAFERIHQTGQMLNPLFVNSLIAIAWSLAGIVIAVAFVRLCRKVKS